MHGSSLVSGLERCLVAAGSLLLRDVAVGMVGDSSREWLGMAG